ncbi:hypothetical protein L211DRAFT_846598 [Terfezia boudieri ATCC MYA-4762]|uniref:Uncharacterized protein n=1 Tax=Terfezia boudieri ATCC MYA-4762 TaxID=1051890 RepID=A0A3N4LVY7_9PEZI|nr:hypothetical protein L211DRAFT_846598 [Terfezia boudieri ATCC MYA-4762]
MSTAAEGCYLEIIGNLSRSNHIVEELEQLVSGNKQGYPKVVDLIHALQELHVIESKKLQELNRLSEVDYGQGAEMFETVKETLWKLHGVILQYKERFNLLDHQ